jgi:hypothetical protein
MRNPLAVLILLLSFALPQARALKIVTVGAQPNQCAMLPELIADLSVVHFPGDWTVHVVCTSVAWAFVRQFYDNPSTNAAFTAHSRKLTFVNGMIYTAGFSLDGYSQRTPQRVLKHELGHITCNSHDEGTADRFVDANTCHK